MIIKKQLIRRTRLLFCLVLFLPWSLSAKKKTLQYPFVHKVQGQAYLLDDTVKVIHREAQHLEKSKILKSETRLKEKAWLRTSENSELQLALSPNEEISVEADSELQIPVINWQNGAVKELRLRKGSLRIHCGEVCSQHLLTDLSDTGLTSGDFAINYDPKIPSIHFSVFRGEVAFRGLENESSVTLKAGDSVQFVGAIENDEVAYDVLLQGRKVAKGHLENVSRISAEEMAKYQEKIKKAQKKPSPILKAKPGPNQICLEPLGKLNECAWTCEKNPKKDKICNLAKGAQCVRSRCNANGVWAEREVLADSQKTKCQTKALVEACDY